MVVIKEVAHSVLEERKRDGTKSRVCAVNS